MQNIQAKPRHLSLAFGGTGSTRELSERPAVSQMAIFLCCSYLRPASKAHFMRLLGFETTDYPIMRRWELPEENSDSRSIGLKYLRRLIRMALWQSRGGVVVREIERINWDESEVIWRSRGDYSKELSPFYYKDGVAAFNGKSSDTYRQNLDGKRRYDIFPTVWSAMPNKPRVTQMVQCLGLPTASGAGLIHKWRQGERKMSPMYATRLLIMLMWDIFSLAKFGDLWRVDWPSETVEWRKGVTWAQRGRNPFDINIIAECINAYASVHFPIEPVISVSSFDRTLPPSIVPKSLRGVRGWASPLYTGRAEVIPVARKHRQDRRQTPPRLIRI